LLLGILIGFYNVWFLQRKISLFSETIMDSEAKRQGLGMISRFAAVMLGAIIALKFDMYLNLIAYLIRFFLLYPVMMIDLYLSEKTLSNRKRGERMRDAPSAPIIDNLFGISWLSVDLSIVLMTVITSIVVLLIGIWCSRKLQMKPTGAQAFMEWVVELVKGLVTATMAWKTGRAFLLLGLTLIMFILVSNVLGMVTTISIGGQEWWTAPTADAGMTLTRAALVVVLSHYYGIKLRGFKEYGKGFFAPIWIMFPFKIIEEFTNTLTLGLRLFGNIFAGGILTALILGMSTNAMGDFSIFGFIGSIVPMLAWQGFSLFVAGIQAFIFTLLTMLYLSHKVESETIDG